MKKAFLHRMPSLKSPETLKEHSTLASTLKALVSGELRLDKQQLEGMETSLSHTGIVRKESAVTKATKGPLNDSNSSSYGQNEESLRLNRKITKEDFSKDRPVSSRITGLPREDFRETVLEALSQLKKQVAEIRDEVYQTNRTGSQSGWRLNNSDAKPPGSCGSLSETWTELCLAGSSSQITTPDPNTPKASLDRRLLALQQSSSGRDRLVKDLPARLADAESRHQIQVKELHERLFRMQTQQSSIRSDLETYKVFFPLTKSHLLDRLDREVCSITTRLELLESSDRRAEPRKETAMTAGNSPAPRVEDNPFCRKESLDIRREIADIRGELKACNQMFVTIGQQIERYSNIDSELRELIAKQQARLGVKQLSQKMLEVEQYIGHHGDSIQSLQIKLTKLKGQSQQSAFKLSQVQAKMQQQPKQKDGVTVQELQQLLQSITNIQDGKLMRIVTDYNENFLTIDQSVCDLKDFIQQVLAINKTITQKLQSMWNHHLTGREQLEEFCKTSGDVYLLLENNIQKICELSKKEMSFEHEVKELKEKMEVTDTISSRCRRVGSLNSSFDMKSSYIADPKEYLLPIDSHKSRIFATRPSTSLLDENIHDQQGSFD